MRKNNNQKKERKNPIEEKPWSSVNESKAGTDENGWEAPTKGKIRWLRLDGTSLAPWSNAREKEV